MPTISGRLRARGRPDNRLLDVIRRELDRRGGLGSDVLAGRALQERGRCAYAHGRGPESSLATTIRALAFTLEPRWVARSRWRHCNRRGRSFQARQSRRRRRSGRAALHMQLNDSAYRRARPGTGDWRALGPLAFGRKRSQALRVEGGGRGAHSGLRPTSRTTRAPEREATRFIDNRTFLGMWIAAGASATAVTEALKLRARGTGAVPSRRTRRLSIGGRRGLRRGVLLHERCGCRPGDGPRRPRAFHSESASRRCRAAASARSLAGSLQASRRARARVPRTAEPEPACRRGPPRRHKRARCASETDRSDRRWVRLQWSDLRHFR